MVKDDELYKRLEVPTNADDNAIRRAYKKMAVKYHPDKNAGDPEAEERFKDISEAYDVLSDPEKRQVYDRYGMDGLRDGGGMGPGMHAEDIFSQFFGGGMFGGGGRRPPRGPKKTKDMMAPLHLSLEELYNGTTKKMKITRKVLCEGCKGTGSKSGRSSRCSTCNGQGVRVIVQQFGPGMFSKQQVICDACNGDGEAISRDDICKTCSGARVADEKKILNIEIDKGTLEDKKIVFTGQSDEAPGCVAGDLIFVVKEKDHPLFVRNGKHLLMKKHIPLVNALCGGEFPVKHLDDRILLVKIEPGLMIQHGATKEVRNQGMPVYTRPYEYGSLFIQFIIDYPESISPAQIQAIQSALKSTALPAPPEDSYEHVSVLANDVDIQNIRGDDDHGGSNAYDEDDADEGHPGVQCATQ